MRKCLRRGQFPERFGVVLGVLVAKYVGRNGEGWVLDSGSGRVTAEAVVVPGAKSSLCRGPEICLMKPTVAWLSEG